MNAVEIEEAVSRLAEAPFDSEQFPFAFLEAFGNKETTLQRLRSGGTNQSDIGGVLQRSNIHIKTCGAGGASDALSQLRNSPKNSVNKVKFILATDGKEFQAENLTDGSTLVCNYSDFHDHFGFFLPLAGISTVAQIRDNAFDIKATGRFNRLYIELLKDNPEWGTEERQADLNHFMARLIFCFFAEDTAIFGDKASFTGTLEKMTQRAPEITHEVLAELFKAMNTKVADREAQGVARWARDFPYVNGGLFSDTLEVPRFSKIARQYLLHIGNLNWTKINPDIFGSMIQAVADDNERGKLGMHYTSVPNILKVLNPLFLDDLRANLEDAGNNPRTLLNLRKRISRIRVFDPACGSGNFLVIAYKELRHIEAEINKRRKEADRGTEIPLTNFRGIEIRHFACEIARLALIIAEYQCDVIYRGKTLALAEFLPLEAANWITCGNALRLNWLSICPPTGKEVAIHALDLFSTPLYQSEIDFENEGGETYICGNPPYLGSTRQTHEQKADLELIFTGRTKSHASLDYVSGWFMKAVDYGMHTPTATAFVATNSICQGQQVAILWPLIFNTRHLITFAHTSFKWSNLASYNAGVTVVIVGISKVADKIRKLYSIDDSGQTVVQEADNINAYLVAGPNVIVEKVATPLCHQLFEMMRGNSPVDGGHLLLTRAETNLLNLTAKQHGRFIHRFYQSAEFIRGLDRFCLWLEDGHLQEALGIPAIVKRLDAVREMRLSSPKEATVDLASVPHRFGEVKHSGIEQTMVVPRVSSENRDFLPVGLVPADTIIGDRNFALYDAPLWNMALVASRLHWVWIGTVCVRMRTDFSYSNTLGWNTFPVPKLTEQNKADLTRCAEDILLAREAHFPATIADLYDSDNMPDNLRDAHDRNDETLERIYIGRRFRNDTERLGKLFEMYTKLSPPMSPTKSTKKVAKKKNN